MSGFQLPASEQAYHDAARAEAQKAEDELFRPRMPEMTAEQRAELTTVIQGARGVLAQTHLVRYLEERASSRMPPGQASAGQVALYQAGYRAFLEDVKNISEWRIPDG